MTKLLGFWVTLCLWRLQQMCIHSMWQNYENQSRDITQVQHNEPLGFTMFTYGNMGEGLLCRNNSGICITKRSIQHG